MDLVLVGIVGICFLFVLIFLNMPVGFALAMVGFVGICVVKGMVPGFSILSLEPYRQASSYILSVIPLFIFMGYLASPAGVSSDAFYVINKWIGHIRGGIAMATTGACSIFAAVCGDSIATAATMIGVALPEMRKRKYADVLSTGCIAAGGTLGFLIPPSIAFIIYAMLTEESIGSLFIAGILPGLLLAICFVAAIYLVCRTRPSLAPSAPKESWRERLKALRYIWGPLVVILLVLGGIYAGIFTPTEAGGVGAFVVLVFGLIYKRLTWQGFTTALRQTARMTGMIFILIIGATIFNRFLVVTEIPLKLADLLAGLAVSPLLILVATLGAYILLGFIMDIIAVLMLVVPILHPALVGLGFDPIWLGVLTILTVLMGQISPPVGIVVYAVGGMVEDVPLFTIFRGVMPFFGAMFVCLINLLAFPQISLFLPNLMIAG